MNEARGAEEVLRVVVFIRAMHLCRYSGENRCGVITPIGIRSEPHTDIALAESQVFSC